MKRRSYQIQVLLIARQLRSFFLLWRRQGGKSTTLAALALDEMSRTPGRLVTYASASLLLGREIIVKEAQVLQAAIADLTREAAQGGLRLEIGNSETHKAYKAALNADDFAELFESQRLLFQLWHDSTTCSRTQVIAPNPATARGWSGTVMLDEFGFIRDFRDLWEAVEPIISSDPSFKFIGATTPPKDDSHYSYELTAPAVGTTFPVDARGNWYTSEAGERIHRVDIFDAYAAGQKLYDRRDGRELTPEEHFKAAEDKDAWRRNYRIEHVLGGSAACGILELQAAQGRGMNGVAEFFPVETDTDFDTALRWIRMHCEPHVPLGLGLDVATTEKETSNPSSISLVEQHGRQYIVRAIIVWKTKDPAIAKERIRRVIHAVAVRGTPPRRLCIDASSERYFAADLAKDLEGLLPVELVISGTSVQVPGREEATNMKTLLGDQLIAAQ
jgi:hypothetical protein